ncbi:hypothetical protein ASE36_11140 [Rhizobium sp. Root274]|nr:hypothetical protein ASC71_11160 [Rhizobium sp. Root1240]KRD29221.1 hypothetical protein ASE36_11140 [Rhizobium sp. Root274]
MRTPPEQSGGVFLMPNRFTAFILGRSPEDLQPPAADGEVQGADATADARHKAEHDNREHRVAVNAALKL